MPVRLRNLRPALDPTRVLRYPTECYHRLLDGLTILASARYASKIIKASALIGLTMPAPARYASKIIKASALIGDTRTLLTQWNLGSSVPENLARLHAENLLGTAFAALLGIAWADAWLVTGDRVGSAIMVLAQAAQAGLIMAFIISALLDERSKLRAQFTDYVRLTCPYCRATIAPNLASCPARSALPG